MVKTIVAAGAGVGVLLVAILLAVFAIRTSGRFSKVEDDLSKKTDATQVAAAIQQKLTDGTFEAKFKKVLTEEITADTAVIKGMITLSKISTGSGDPFKPEPPDSATPTAVKDLASAVGTVAKSITSLVVKADEDEKKRAKEKATYDAKLKALEEAAKAEAAAEAKAKEAEPDPTKGLKGIDKILDDYIKSKDGLMKVAEELEKVSSKIKKVLEPPAPKKPKTSKAIPPADEEARMIGPRLPIDETGAGVRFVLHCLEPPREAVKVLAHRLERTRSDQEFLRAQIRPIHKPKYWWLETWYLEQQKLRWWVDYRLKKQVEDLSNLLAVAKNELARSPASRIPIRIPWCWTTEKPPRRFAPVVPAEQVGAATLHWHGYNRYPVT